MRVKLDENLPARLKPRLGVLGHDVSTAAEERLLREPDEVIAVAARTEGRMLFTLDLDFADPRKFAPGTHAGIVLFRPRVRGAGAVDRFVLRFVETTDLKGLSSCHVTVHPTIVKVRRPPRTV